MKTWKFFEVSLIQMCFFFVWVVSASASPWATPAQEALDEIHDDEIFRAVLTSMAEYHRRRASHRQKRAESSVCYDQVGCFHDSGPFGYLDMLPSSPDDVKTRFLLYSGKARGDSPVFDVEFSNMSSVWSWAGKSFNSSTYTKVIVHGFGSSCSHVWIYEMRSALMAVEDCNVICVDWEAGAVVPNYVRAAANTRLVGKQVALLLSGLAQHVGLSLEKVHLIGFSLGAHAAGFAGAELKNISRITGLDPAGPLFENQDTRARLDSTDASFVDVIHSNGENLILGGLGAWQQMGHIDFYPNGGRMQKGCSNLFLGAVSDIIWSASDVEGRSLCNHRRAYKFFTDSVSPRCHFPSFPCDSYDKFLEGQCFPCSGDRKCGNMGYYADKSDARGTLFLITREEEPFCAHQYHVRVESTPTEAPVTSYGRIQLTLVGHAGINETFTLTQKDDEMLKGGSSLARIVVPHPILQDPQSVELTYTAYSGWISSGLATWSVDRVTLMDSFGKSLSICKKGLILETGVPVLLRLYPGQCNLPQGDETTEGWTTSSPGVNAEISTNDPLLPSDLQVNISKYLPTLVVQIGDDGVESPPSGDGIDELDHLSLFDVAAPFAEGLLGNLNWKPIETVNNDGSETNSLEHDSPQEDSRAFNSDIITIYANGNKSIIGGTDESVVINDTNFDSSDTNPPSTNAPFEISMRSSQESTFHPEIKEPILLATSTARSSPTWPREFNAASSIEKILENLKQNITEPISGSEIGEPVLNPKSSVTSTTLKSSNVKTRHIAGHAADNSQNIENQKWVPNSELNPPPLNIESTWQIWTSVANDNSTPITTSNRRNNVVKEVPKINSTNGKKENFTQRSQPPSIILQFFPERLVSMLMQAERYARTTFMQVPTGNDKLLLTIEDNSDKESGRQRFTEKPQGTERSSMTNLLTNTQRKPKYMTTVHPPDYEYSTLSSETDFYTDNKNHNKTNLRSSISDHSKERLKVLDAIWSDEPRISLPYNLRSQNSEEKSFDSHSRFIPLKYPQTDHDLMHIITTTHKTPTVVSESRRFNRNFGGLDPIAIFNNVEKNGTVDKLLSDEGSIFSAIQRSYPVISPR